MNSGYDMLRQFLAGENPAANNQNQNQNYAQQQSVDTLQKPQASKRIFEISSKDDLPYLEPDDSGQKQIAICEAENRIYVGRYNHSRKATDWRKSYIEESEMPIPQPADNSEIMNKIVDVLVGLSSKLDAIDEKQDSVAAEIKQIKKKAAQPTAAESIPITKSKAKPKKKAPIVADEDDDEDYEEEE